MSDDFPPEHYMYLAAERDDEPIVPFSIVPPAPASPIEESEDE